MESKVNFSLKKKRVTIDTYYYKERYSCRELDLNLIKLDIHLIIINCVK